MLVNAYATHRAPPALTFHHRLLNRRDLSDPELPKHLQGFAGFVMDGGKRPMTAMRYGLMRHLERVRHHLAIEVEQDQMNRFAAWAREANAIVFLPDSSVRAPDGKVLVTPGTGDPQPGAEIPYPADAVSRKAKTEAALEARGIAVMKSLPPVIAEVEVDLRDARDVTERFLALFACALRAESLASGKPISRAELEARMPLAFKALTPKEEAFMADDAPDKQTVVNNAWRYEAVLPLTWSIGAVDALPFPSAVCDVPALVKTVAALDAAFYENVHLRGAGAILDALDTTFRLHWATTQARVKKTDPPPGVDAGVVAERHYALNWLTCFEGADWDDVTTPT